ncbi:MAG: hypothetical protein GY869_01860 [Planctomycetes bacterium]|nr:hypothetical protein [Planctomycetota bacterium]
MGANLIANQLEQWKEGVDEAGINEWVSENAQDNPELRDSLDKILKHFDVISQVKAGVDEEDLSWFSETLRKELQQLGNLPKYEANLIGSGAIAQGDGSVAIGKATRAEVFSREAPA